MAKKMLIDATHAEETRVVVVDGNRVDEFDFENVNKRQLQGNIYLAKVTRVEPSLQAAFVDYGGNRHGFLAFAEIHPDYYQIPLADRKALLAEERELARAEDDDDNRRSRSSSRGNRRDKDGRDGRDRRPAKAEAATSNDAVIAGDLPDQMADQTADMAADQTADQAEDGDARAPAPASIPPQISGMDVVDLGDEVGADALYLNRNATRAEVASDDERPYTAIDHASDTDDEIESVADEDLSEDIRKPRQPRARRYKIQEVVKVRQIMLVQVVKEERGNKGAALTTYLSLAGRYCVLMPNTARGGGISRKITQAADRKKLKDIAGDLEVPEGAGLIIRTAGAKRTKAEIKRDYEYLMRLWEEIRELTLRSIAPAQIYEEGNLIKRSIRDLYSREIDEILVEGEAGYRSAKDFMRMIMPAHARVVQRYTEPMPLFARFQVESYLAGMFNPVVQLKSGGYIVIGITEALVAVDVNSGRATKEGSIEETALKTNLEAAEEVARQLRLRDLAGLIVIDFIDMEERRNNAAVEKRLKDKLKTDRARIQVGRISGFGLLEMSRQRLRPGMLESTTQPCPHCHGTGLIRSDDSMALQILRALEEEGTRKRSREVLLRGPVAVINYLINHKREHIALIEARYGMAVRLEADPHLVSPDYTIEKFKTALRVVPDAAAVISGSSAYMGAAVDEDDDDPELPLDDEEDEVEADEVETKAEPRGERREGGRSEPRGEAEGDGSGKKKRRRRRRKKPGQGQDQGVQGDEGDDGEEDDLAADAGDDASDDVTLAAPAEAEAEAARETEAAVEAKAKPAKSSRSSKSSASKTAAAKSDAAKDDKPAKAAKAPTSRSSKSKSAKAEGDGAVVAEAAAADGTEGETAAKPKLTRTRGGSKATKAKAEAEAAVPVEAPVDSSPAPVLQADPGEAPVVAKQTLQADPADPATAPAAPAAAEPAADEAKKPRKAGWWSLGR